MIHQTAAHPVTADKPGCNNAISAKPPLVSGRQDGRPGLFASLRMSGCLPVWERCRRRRRLSRWIWPRTASKGCGTLSPSPPKSQLPYLKRVASCSASFRSLVPLAPLVGLLANVKDALITRYLDRGTGRHGRVTPLLYSLLEGCLLAV
jgi:hypothetical protein